jgi:hypothetical protein
MRTNLLAAVSILTIAGSGAAFAGKGDHSVPNGYAVPDFWGQIPAQQAPAFTTPEHGTGSSISTYPTQSMPAIHGTYLFPPNPYGG